MTADKLLEGPRRSTASGSAPRSLVVFLHGLGADGADLISLAEPLSQLLPETEFVAPDAPFPCDMPTPWGGSGSLCSAAGLRISWQVRRPRPRTSMPFWTLSWNAWIWIQAAWRSWAFLKAL